jgi:hypothetical protein
LLYRSLGITNSIEPAGYPTPGAGTCCGYSPDPRCARRYSAPHIASASALISACANERTMPRSRSVPACAEREVRHLDSDHAGQVLALERGSVQDAAEGSAKGPNLPYEAEMKADHAIVAPDR